MSPLPAIIGGLAIQSGCRLLILDSDNEKTGKNSFVCHFKVPHSSIEIRNGLSREFGGMKENRYEPACIEACWQSKVV